MNECMNASIQCAHGGLRHTSIKTRDFDGGMMVGWLAGWLAVFWLVAWLAGVNLHGARFALSLLPTTLKINHGHRLIRARTAV
jgi:hypothetical protein